MSQRDDPARERRLGLLLGVGAYATWGVVPLFWNQLHGVPALEILAHRAAWGLVAFALFAIATGQVPATLAAARRPRTLLILAGSGLLLAGNWGLFIWATLSGHLLQASLGYFINPLVSVALGVGFLGERLTRRTLGAIALAAIGVVWLAIAGGAVPWVALALALSFGAYGLIRKVIAVPALVGSTLETALLAPIAIGYLVVLEVRGVGAFGHASAKLHLLLIAAGFVTAVPLAWFTAAARRLPLSTIGFLQYLAPTGQFVTALAAMGEHLSRRKLEAFGFIWVALVVFTVELIRPTRPPAGAKVQA